MIVRSLLLLILVALLLCVSSPAQNRAASRLPAQERISVGGWKTGDVAPETALATATEWRTRLGLQRRAGSSKTQLFYTNRPNGRTINLDTDDGWEFTMDAKSGVVRLLFNTRRSDEQYRRLGRTGRALYRDAAAWKAHLRRWANRLGVPVGAGFVNFVRKGDGQVRDANSAGYVAATFGLGDGRRWIVNCDPQDGALMMFHVYRLAEANSGAERKGQGRL